MPNTLDAGTGLPVITLPLAGGGDMTLGGKADWRLLVVYRGKHLPTMQKIPVKIK